MTCVKVYMANITLDDGRRVPIDFHLHINFGEIRARLLRGEIRVLDETCATVVVRAPGCDCGQSGAAPPRVERLEDSP